MKEQKELRTLLFWLAAYVAAFIVVVSVAGKISESIPVLTNLISGFAGAAFAIMRIGRDKNDQ